MKPLPKPPKASDPNEKMGSDSKEKFALKTFMSLKKLVPGGVKVTVSATGKIRLNEKLYSSPEGIEGFPLETRLRQFKYGALLMKFGWMDWELVGSSRTFYTHQIGELSFVVNDYLDEDNEGEFEIEVRVEPVNRQ